MFASWRELDFAELFRRKALIPPLPKRKPDRHGGRWLIDCVTAFDIETSRIDLPIPDDAKQNSHSFMYIWQYQIEEYTIIGRTWEDFIQMMERIRDSIIEVQGDLPYSPRLLVFVHNLPYEWQWLQAVYKFENEDVFFREARKPLYCRMWDCIEFRCSFALTNMSLDHLTKQLGVEEKLSGQKFNYDIMRYPWTPLTDYELEYCVRDVRSLVQCIKIRLEKDGDTLQTMPLTSTGYVRRDCKKAIEPIYLDIRDMKPDLAVYKLLRQAFRGGNTHANRRYAGKILHDVYSYDMTSCYPAQQLTKKFPIKKFKFINDRLSLDRVIKFVGLGYAVVATYVFEELQIKKDVPIPYLPLAKTRSYDFLVQPKREGDKGERKKGGIDNGRILYAKYCVVTLTEIDLKIVLKQYDYKTIKVVTAMVAKKDYLPDEYRDVIRKYYTAKTELKGATDPELIYQYNKSKEKLNAIYGMSCQDPIHAEIRYDGGAYTNVNLYDFPDKAEKALQDAPFPYQFGVYCTAYARESLQSAIDKAGIDKMVYCDTDSVKCIGELDLSDINTQREKIAIREKAFALDRKGIPHYMGVFESEGKYDQFITQGAKRYAYIKDGKMGITVSGISKKINEESGVPFAVEELGSLENFVEGRIWYKAGGTISVYNDADDFMYTDTDTGRNIKVIPNVAIIPSTYKLGYSKDYRELLTDVMLYGEYVDKRS